MAITLLDMLLNAQLINREQFEEALRNRVLYGGKIGTSLIELGYVSEEDLARFLSRKLGVPYVHPDNLLNIPPEVIDLLGAVWHTGTRDTVRIMSKVPVQTPAFDLVLLVHAGQVTIVKTYRIVLPAPPSPTAPSPAARNR